MRVFLNVEIYVGFINEADSQKMKYTLWGNCTEYRKLKISVKIK